MVDFKKSSCWIEDGFTLDSTEEEGEEDVVIEQYVQDVLDFSSQYGSDISISYTAYNISGRPSKYPDYGDFPQAFVMRTYGQWWEEAPSRASPIQPQNQGAVVSQDYIDVTFEQKVFPSQVSIYETYNPGSVVGLWAGDGAGGWGLLWTGPPQAVQATPRIFSPQLNSITFSTNLLRVEFDHRGLDYYTELDAILLVGRVDTGRGQRGRGRSLPTVPATTRTPGPPSVGLISSRIRGMTINTFNSQVEITNTLNSLSSLALEYTALLQDLSSQIEGGGDGGGGGGGSTSVHRSTSSSAPGGGGRTSPSTGSLSSSPPLLPPPPPLNSGHFDLLPDETVLKILGYLDLVSLSRCSRVNRHLRRLATDTLLYTQLNLKPYWSRVDWKLLDSLACRASHLQAVDLSWCGNYETITPPHLNRFIRSCGKLLTIIRLNSCKYINDSVITEISNTCKNLKELCLRNCFQISSEGFRSLSSLSTLERLDLYRTAIESSPLLLILAASPRLNHINLGSCVKVSSMDTVAHGLGEHCRELISVDFWKTYSLTPLGVKALANCSKLEEIDLGWCLGVSIPGDCMSVLAAGCPRLVKLFLAALRGLTDRDLLPFLSATPRLQQVDLLGVRSITPHMCHRFLTTFKHLRLFDLSFCDQIQDDYVQQWRSQFPHVSIKRSFQSDGVPSPYQHY